MELDQASKTKTSPLVIVVIIAVLAALPVCGGAALAVFVWLQAGEEPSVMVNGLDIHPDREVDVIKAKHQLQPGSRLTRDALTIETVKAHRVPADALTVDRLPYFIDGTTVVGLRMNQVVLQRDVTPPPPSE